MIHEIRRIDGGREFRTGKNVFRIGGNTFYDRKNKIPMKILEFKRSRNGLIAEFRGIWNGFPNQVKSLAMKALITVYQMDKCDDPLYPEWSGHIRSGEA